MKKIIAKIVGAPITSAAGCIAGIPEIVQGINEHNYILILKGVGLLLVGIAAADFVTRR
jgi:hypothetical protein